MTNTRADKIFAILEKNKGRMKVAEILAALQKVEGVTELRPAAVSVTVRQDNRTKENQGKAPRFNFLGEGEEHGYVSIRGPVKVERQTSNILKNYATQIPAIVEEANQKARDELKAAIQKLDWREFESNFLLRILEALGFHGVEITQATHDGGKDALCQYKRGIVQSQAIVSAKHWKTQNVSAEEVQRLRGIKGDEDTGIIVTSSNFSPKAQKEAVPSQNQRAIVLIDGDLIVETCFANAIGVKEVAIPKLYQFLDFDSE